MPRKKVFELDIVEVDLWAQDFDQTVEAKIVQKKRPEVDLNWLNDETLIQNRLRKIRPKEFHKTSELPALELPHPGFSYNPTFNDHQDLLRRAVEEEKLKLRNEAKTQRAAVPKTVFEDVAIKTEDLEIEIKEEDESDDDKKLKLQPKLRKRQQRRNEREAKEQERLLKDTKNKKKLESDIYKIKTYKKEIIAKEKFNEARLKKKIEQKIHHTRFGQHAIGRMTYKSLSLNPALSDELTPTIREVRAASNNSLLVDRFKSLQKRNIIEPRVKNSSKRKYKLKKFTRPSDREEWEKSGVWNDIKIPL